MVREHMDQDMENMLLHVAEQHDWHKALMLAGSFWRFPLFVCLAPEMTRQERREQLADIWTACDNIWAWREIALRYLHETGYIGDLPKPTTPLTLYRGVSSRVHRLGLSWSLSRETARKFTHPFSRGGIESSQAAIYEAVAPPEAFLAGFSDRDEQEYVVDPALLQAVRLVEAGT